MSWPSAGQILDEPIGLEDPRVRKAIEDGAAFPPSDHEPCSPKHREMLAHVGYLAADPGTEVAHGQLALGERFEDTQALRVRESPSDRGIASSFGFS